MDDEIVKEEHDILEHPQVKAAFPDLSNVLIQAHTTGVSLFEEARTYTKEYVNLLEERVDYADTDLKEKIDKFTVFNDLATSNNIDNEELEDRNSDIVDASAALVISDNESNKAPPTNPEENVDIEEERTDSVTKIAENKLVENIHLIPNDEVKGAPISKIRDRDVDKIDKEATENGVVLVKKAPENDEILKEDPENREVIENVGIFKGDPDDDKIVKEGPRNDEIIKEGLGLTEDCEMNYNKEEYIKQTEVKNADTTEREYLHVHMKEEIDFIPIKQEINDDFEDYKLEENSPEMKHLYELLPTEKFSCNTCNETFNNQNDLEIHNKVHIKTEPSKISKAQKGDENPILRNLLAKAAAVPKLMEQNQPQIKREPSDSIDKPRSKFKCMLCSDIFDHYSAARRHRLAHPESCSNGKKSAILKRLVPKVNQNNSKAKLKYEDDCEYKTKKVKRAKKINDDLIEAGGNKNRPFDLIPESTLFKCPKCSLHFTSPVGGSVHMAKQVCCAIDVWTCPICEKKLRKIDESCHKKQHELSTNIKIYKITKKCNKRTLCKCLKCGVYFNYILLKVHINECGKIPTAKCQKCNILLPKPKLLEHYQKHETLNLKPKDFILVDFAVINDKTKSEPGITVKTEPGTVTQSKVINNQTFEKEKVKIYYCKHCQSSSTSRSREVTRRSHLSSKCLVRYKYRCYYCELCGLQIPTMCRSAHDILHAEKTITLNDLEFYEFTSLKRIVPTSPDYPSCGKCNIHFLDRDMKKNHICDENYDNCEYCGDKFELAALNVHRPFHKLQDVEN